MPKVVTVGIRTARGEPTKVGDLTVTPESQAVILAAGLGAWQTGVVWNRSAAVLVSRNNEQTRIPIVNLTRIGMLAATGVGIVAAMLLLRVQNLLETEQP